MPSRFLIVSNKHGLLPFALRLAREEVDLTVTTHRERFDEVWEGAPWARTHDVDWPEVVGAAHAGGLVVVSDVPGMVAPLRTAPRAYLRLTGDEGALREASVRVGAWFDGTMFQATHLLVVDWGAWPGGLGPMVPGGMTLVRIPAGIDEAVAQLLDQSGLLDPLVAQGFKGLVQVGIKDVAGRLGVVGWQAGWGFLQSHAFLAELTTPLGELLGGAPPSLGARFVTVIPVGIPPYPLGDAVKDRRASAPEGLLVNGLSPPEERRVWWHDVTLAGGKLYTAGTDGLVGVVRGHADTSELARHRALAIATHMGLPEKGFRPDVGLQVQATLAQLEGEFGVVLA